MTMVGRKVTSAWQIDGEVVKWEPLGSAMCDCLVRNADGREIWVSSRDLSPSDGLGALPSRRVAQAVADKQALADLQAIRAKHVADFNRPWPGAEFGKGLVGQVIDDVISAVKDRIKEQERREEESNG